MTLLYVMSRSRQQVSSALSLGELSDGEIYQMTRFPRSAVEELCELMTDDLQRPSARAYALPVDTQVLAALQFYATGSFQWLIGRSCRLSQSSVSAAVSNVTEALVRRASNFIRFPTDQPTLLNNKLAFHRVAGFPNVIAAIDCTHIAIKAPSANEEAFVNRKGVHTINVQAACDADMKLLNIVAKWPGSTHDSFVWRSSGLRSVFEHRDVQGGWLLGT